MKRLAALLLICCLAIMPVMASADGEAQEKVTLRVFTGIETYTPDDINSMTIYVKSEEATGVHIEWETVAQSSYADKLATLLATDDLPEVIFGKVTAPQLVQYGEQGSFIPMEDLYTEELAPNLCGIIAQHPELKDFVTAPDGHIYGVPVVTQGLWNQVSRVYNFNTQWLQNLGIAEPANLTEFKDMLIAFRDNDPNGNGIKDEIPFTFEGSNFSVAVFEYIFGAYGLPVGGSLLDVADGKVVSVAQDERFKAAIGYIADLYAEGLIDPDSFVMDNSQWKAKINGTPVVVGVSPNWDYNDNISDPEILAQYGMMKPLSGDDGTEPVVFSPALYGLNRGFGVITKECEHVEAAMRWIDYWYDMVNSSEASEGPIGERQYIDENGTILTGIGDKTVVGELPPRASVCINPYTCRALLKEYYVEGKMGIPSTYPKVNFITEFVLPFADKDAFPTNLYYTLEESETISMLETDIKSLINSKSAEWIMKGTVDAEWDDFQSTLSNMRIDDYLAAQQSAYDRMYAAD